MKTSIVLLKIFLGVMFSTSQLIANTNTNSRITYLLNNALKLKTTQVEKFLNHRMEINVLADFLARKVIKNY